MKKPGIFARCADGGICTRDSYCVIAALPRRHEKSTIPKDDAFDCGFRSNSRENINKRAV